MTNPFTSKSAPALNQLYSGDEFTMEGRKIERARKMAELMQQESLGAGPQGQMVSGIYVAPSWTQGLAKALQGYAAKHAIEKADNRELELGRKVTQDRSNVLKNYQDMTTGKPYPIAGPNPDGSVVAQGPAIPDQAGAIQALMTSKHADLQNLGMQQMMQESQRKQLANILSGGTPGAVSGSPQGGIPGVDPRAVQLAASGLPGADKIGGWIQDANKPQSTPEGATAWTLGPDGQPKVMLRVPKSEPGINYNMSPNGTVLGASGVPGYSEAKAQQQAATEGAKAGFEMVNLPMGDGSTKTMTKAEYLAMTNPQPNQGSPVPSGVVTGSAGTWQPGQIGPSSKVDRTPFDKERLEVLKSELAANPNDPALIKEATNAGLFGQKKPALGVTQSTASKQFSEGQAKFFSDTYGDLQKGGMSANGTIGNLQRMSQLMDGIQTGKIQPTAMQLASLAEGFGVKLDPKLGAKQAVEALSNEMALQLRNPSGGAGMPGAMSDADREYLKTMVPGMSRTPEGNKLMIEASMKKAQRDQEVAQLARSYVATHGQLDNGFYQELQTFANQNHLFPSKKETPAQPTQSGISADGRTASGKIGGLPATKNHIDSLLKKYGG